MAESVDETSSSIVAMITAALQTSRLTSALLGDGFGAEARANRESIQRMQNAEILTAARVAKIANDDARANTDLRRRNQESTRNEQRAQEKHTAVLGGYTVREAKTWLEAAATVVDAQRRATDSEARRERERDKADAEIRLTKARTGITKADARGRRRERKSKNKRANELHDLQMEGLRDRNKNANEIHGLNKQKVTEEIEQRRRASGLTEVLAARQRSYSDAAEAAGENAAAEATADIGQSGPSDAGADAADLPVDARARVQEVAVGFTEAAADSHLADTALAGDDTPPVSTGSSIGEAIRAATTPAEGIGLPSLETGTGPMGRGRGAGAAPEAGL